MIPMLAELDNLDCCFGGITMIRKTRLKSVGIFCFKQLHDLMVHLMMSIDQLVIHLLSYKRSGLERNRVPNKNSQSIELLMCD